jgi:hypothetical protein
MNAVVIPFPKPIVVPVPDVCIPCMCVWVAIPVAEVLLIVWSLS